MFLLSVITFTLGLESYVQANPTRRASPVLYDGRAPSQLTAEALDKSSGPYLTSVKGDQDASHYFQIFDDSVPTTPLWKPVQEQAVHTTIDSSSIFTPTDNKPQLGFRRSELIAQGDQNGDRPAFNAKMQSGITAFHFSVQTDPKNQLDFKHEYQPVFIEPPDGSHVFDLQTGTPFNTTAPDIAARTLRIRSHDSTVLFQTTFDENIWHNFAVVVDWDKPTLQVFYSTNGDELKSVTAVEDNKGAVKGPTGVGDYHFGVLKLPLINPTDTPENQADLAHFGKQEDTTESLFYSGIFVEGTQDGVSTGNGNSLPVGN